MGQNSLDAFVPLDSPRLVAACNLLFDPANGIPSKSVTSFVFAGAAVPAYVVQLSPRSVRSPYVFDKMRSVEFCVQFMGELYQPGDLSIWIPETNFLHRIKPDVNNTVVSPLDAITAAHTWPMVSGQINVNAQPDSSLYLVKEFDALPGSPTPWPHGCWAAGVFNVQNWEVSPIQTGGA